MISETSVSEPLGAASGGGAFGFAWSEPKSGPRKWLFAQRGWLGLAGVILTGMVIALSAAGTDVLLPESVRPVPRWLAGVFGRHGVDLGLGGLIAVLGVMFVSYAVAVRAAHQLSARAVLIGVVALYALLFLAPPLLSTDVFSYMAYGRIGALYGANPYLHGPSAIALDPSYPFIPARWVTTPTSYGPLFTALSYLLAPLGIAWNVLAYKAIAAMSSLVIVVVVWNAARLRGLNAVKAVAVVGLNPVIVVFAVGGGHNDLLMLAILLTGVYVLLRQKERTSGALIVAASAVKLTAGLVLPFALAQSGSRREGRRGRRAVLTGVGLAVGVAGVFSFAAFGTGPLHLLDTLPDIQNHGGSNSIPGLLLALLGLQALSGAVGLMLDAGFVICLVWLVRRVWMGELDWITGAGWATVALLITAGSLVPWYVGWLVPLAALSNDRRLLATAIGMTGLGLTTL
ncbi:MAG: polyprenol phosphomannose-dependent alpha 1,6 mannosyltransferase MptB [Solirubrobacterales bacterium]|nr:polyprenol phosphomannose-dependent alpha 1,6 mannosyltransferase MptB [Solirubrobacterales bacterium]